MAYDKNIVWKDNSILFQKSAEDNLYVMPWRLLHDGYQVTKQDTVVRVSPDSGSVISHSRWTVGGRIIAAKIFVDKEETFWYWLSVATKDTALPCWIYDAKVNGFMRCYITEQPTLSPAGTSIKGCYVNLQLYSKSRPITVINFVSENAPERLVVEGSSNKYVTEKIEVIY